MKSNYVWIEYVSFEHEIEHRKKEYYRKLMEAQRSRPNENVTEWVYFFLDCLKDIQQQLLQKLKEKERREAIGIREQQVYTIVEHNPGISSGEIVEKLKIPPSTIKRILAGLVASRNLIVHGAGRGTTYSIAATELIKHDVTIRLTNEERIKEFTLPQLGSFVQIKKIVLTPLFDWKHPDEWSKKLFQNGLYFTIQMVTAQGVVFRQPYSIAGFNDPTYYQPVFIINPNIVLPDQLQPNGIGKMNYPIKCTIELSGSVERFDFDVMLVIDEG
jgi:hypothetical protein